MEASRHEALVDFSVENLLGQLAHYTETSEEQDEAEKLERFLHRAAASETLANHLGEVGNQLIRQVETYLASDEAQALAKFQDIVQQLGDLCLDHADDHATAETTMIGTDNYGGMGHDDGHSHGHHADTSKQQSSKTKNKKRPPTLFEYFIKRKVSSKQASIFLCP